MLNLAKVKTYSVRVRKSKVRVQDFGRPPVRGTSFRKFYASLPGVLRASELREIVQAIVAARKKKRAVIFMCGAHVIKCGLNPVLVELMKRKVITCFALNSACVIHDFEIAFQGKTSEDVAASLKDGKFGMGKETAEFINSAVKQGVARGLGMGSAVASQIAVSKLPHQSMSLLYNAYQRRIPVCVHVAIGTDIIHQHPSFDAAATAQGSVRDFYRLTEEIMRINKGGVVLNFGSAVILPEVFLKALNLARNLGKEVKGFVTANFDMVYHYRPAQNIVTRPVMDSGKGYYLIGHHEIMLPLLAQAIIDTL
jgi:deoxyhypusine synthase